MVKIANQISSHPDRREGENHAARIVDDIISIMTYLDEHIKLNSMHSTRLYKGDLALYCFSGCWYGS